MTEPTVIAVDWSGAKQPKRPQSIWVTAIRAGRVIERRGGWSREEAVEFVTTMPPPVIAGFDFCFGVPAWFARGNGCRTVHDVWHLAARDGERWLEPTWPFWNTRCDVEPAQRFRATELRNPPAKSVFQCVGAGMVGPGSVRGMPLLRVLREAGFAIWPFDAPTDRTALEIYPSKLVPLAACDPPFASDDDRDATCSASVIWRKRETIAALSAAIDPLTRLEGEVWIPFSAR